MESLQTKSLAHKISDSFLSDLSESYRRTAAEQFIATGLPTTKEEEYRFAPITHRLEKSLSWNRGSHTSTIANVDGYTIPKLKAHMLVIVNGVFNPTLSSLPSEKEVIACALPEAIAKHSTLLENHFNKLIPSNRDGFTALNTAAWTDGVFLHVKENHQHETPFFVLHLFDAQQHEVISNTRLVLILEKGAKATVIEKFDTTGSHPSFHNLVEELSIQENAVLEYCRIQNDQGNSHQVTNTLLHQSNASKLNTFTLTLNGQTIRNNFGIVIDGENCESHFYGLYLLKGNTLADNHTVVDHKKPNSFSNEIYKGVMDEKSKGVFNGKIFVRPLAQKTNAFQSNRNILLTDTATINTKPQLEIWADDVKCSHGCTSGQLDEEALFYLRSRGIDHTSAKAMLLYAFAAEVLEPVKNESLKNYLDALISERLHQNF